MTRRPLPLTLWRWVTRVAGPSLPILLARRAARGKEDPDRVQERFGRPGAERPDGVLVWLHGASVGETRVNLALARTLAAARPALNFLITTHTLTGAQTVARADMPRTIHQFAPLDTPGAARRFLEAWRPDLAVFAESELWPVLIEEADARDIPMALINARMSQRSLQRWARRAPATAAWLLSRFSWIGAADAPTAGGLADLSGRAITATGNLKLDAPPPDHDPAALEALNQAIGGRAVWIAASTHDGEEATVLHAHHALRFGAPEALLILSPRHPERGDAVEDLIAAAGFTCARRSRGEAPGAETDVYLADTLGEMGLLLRAAPVALLGGSLVPGIGGHNPAEPIQTGTALVTGPYTDNFSDAFRALEDAGGARIADGPAELSVTLAELIFDAQSRAAMQAAAEGVMAQSAGALGRTADALLDLLPGAAR